MHVTRVELDNIKAYERRAFDFEPGTTAIVGPNGAGKTTILEAIAWTLFDTLDYPKDDFLRRGAKRGSVRVTFESGTDGRSYTVYRDTANGYYIFDLGLNAKIAEQKANVMPQLRLLLGVEPGTDVQALFRSAIGVPQGTLTADFLRPARQRMDAFNRLLKVEEYVESSNRLLKVERLIGERVAEARERIGRAEGTLARYEELTNDHKSATERAAELDAALSVSRIETEDRERVVKLLDAAEQRVAETRARHERAAFEREGAERRLRDLQIELDAALAARERHRATEPDSRAHLAALGALQGLETERQERDRARAESERVERMIVSADADVRRISDALESAQRARTQLATLEPEIAMQGRLERERDQAKELRALAVAARDQLRRLDTELDQLRKQYERTKESLRLAESAGWTPEQVERLQGQRTEVETALSRAERAKAERKPLSKQRDDLTREITRLRASLSVLEHKTIELERRALGAGQLARLEADERELSEQAANLRAEIARDEKTREETRGGVCPVLREKCTSFSAGQTYTDYFNNLIAENRARLKSVQAETARAAKAVVAAREASVAVAQLGPERERLAQERARMSEREHLLAQVDERLAAISSDDGALDELRTRLMGLDAELIPAREALQRFAHVVPLREQLSEIEQRGKRKRDERAELAAAANGIENLEREIAETESRLRALNDPRGRAAALRVEAERIASLETDATAARGVLKEFERERKTFVSRLARFADFESRWSASVAERERTIAAHREHLGSSELAATVEAREKESAGASKESERAAKDAEKAERAHADAVAAYDGPRHASERESLTLARSRAAALAAQLEGMSESVGKLTLEIARLEEVRAKWQEELRAQEKLKRLDETTEFMRETLKKAGPEVTKSYVAHISVEANQLFREITGEAGRTLRWTSDYEIVVEEGGYERSFVNLSGGEQMAAALAVRLALLKQLSDIRVAFFDEPTVNMDAERRENLARQIGQVRHFDQLFVISHDDTFEETVDHVLLLARREEGATA
ncbi:MAG: repair protein SbcC/Rad50 [Acidobacteriota bacterium]|nr:repair protein SbcC/Rad50 [Acidobacteriota bacterium]